MTVATPAHRARPLRFGLTTASPRSGSGWRTFAREVEAVGFDVLTFPDHLFPTVPPFTGAVAAAAATDRLRVGTLVINNDFRHPVETARESAGVTTISDDRFELGIGAGHMKSEYDAAGIDYDAPGTRVARLAESVSVIRALLDGAPVEHEGDHFRVHAAAGALVAAPDGRVPMLIGGNGTRVLQLAGRVADIVGFAGISHNRDATAVQFTHFTAEGLLDRITVVREAAGDRFADIELNVLVQAVVPTDDRAAAAARLAAEFGAGDADLLLESPFVLLGTPAQMADQIRDRQQRFGLSYWSVFDAIAGRPSAMPAMAEVIALLR